MKFIELVWLRAKIWYMHKLQINHFVLSLSAPKTLNENSVWNFRPITNNFSLVQIKLNEDIRRTQHADHKNFPLQNFSKTTVTVTFNDDGNNLLLEMHKLVIQLTFKILHS